MTLKSELNAFAFPFPGDDSRLDAVVEFLAAQDVETIAELEGLFVWTSAVSVLLQICTGFPHARSLQGAESLSDQEVDFVSKVAAAQKTSTNKPLNNVVAVVESRFVY